MNARNETTERDLAQLRPELAESIAELPSHMQEGVVQYILRGRPPGGFLQAVFENNLMRAASRADEENAYLLRLYARVLYEAPMGCYGSPDVMKSWIEHGGLLNHHRRADDE